MRDFESKMSAAPDSQIYHKQSEKFQLGQV